MESIRLWLLRRLHIEPAQPRQLRIQESMTYEDNAALNRIWYTGDPEELSQVCAQLGGTSFWSMSARSRKVQRIHTGLPGMIVDTLSQLITADMLGAEVGNEPVWQQLLDAILDENNFHDIIEYAVGQLLIVGDGAFKLTYDPEVSGLPVITFVPGDRVRYKTDSGRITEVVFFTEYTRRERKYLLREHYGYGYVRYVLTDASGVPVALDTLEETAGLLDIDFDKSICLAVPVRFRRSRKYEGRGQSIFDRKRGNFDALDEAWSQWMHAVRKSHVKTYVPAAMAAYDPQTGEPLRPDDFTDNFVTVPCDMGENAKNQITTVQPHIEHEGYLAAYMTALDLCLQGVISPSTLGIDVKKMDNAEAQREKEKVTLYTRNQIIGVLQKTLPALFEAALYLYAAAYGTDMPENLQISVPFGEYANPSFESQVETLGRAKTSRIISNEALVEELYGDTKSDEWKAAEIVRLNAADGMSIPGDDVF